MLLSAAWANCTSSVLNPSAESGNFSSNFLSNSELSSSLKLANVDPSNRTPLVTKLPDSKATSISKGSSSVHCWTNKFTGNSRPSWSRLVTWPPNERSCTLFLSLAIRMFCITISFTECTFGVWAARNDENTTRAGRAKCIVNEPSSGVLPWSAVSAFFWMTGWKWLSPSWVT